VHKLHDLEENVDAVADSDGVDSEAKATIESTSGFESNLATDFKATEAYKKLEAAEKNQAPFVPDDDNSGFDSSSTNELAGKNDKEAANGDAGDIFNDELDPDANASAAITSTADAEGEDEGEGVRGEADVANEVANDVANEEQKLEEAKESDENNQSDVAREAEAEEGIMDAAEEKEEEANVVSESFTTTAKTGGDADADVDNASILQGNDDNDADNDSISQASKGNDGDDDVASEGKGEDNMGNEEEEDANAKLISEDPSIEGQDAEEQEKVDDDGSHDEANAANAAESESDNRNKVKDHDVLVNDSENNDEADEAKAIVGANSSVNAVDVEESHKAEEQPEAKKQEESKVKTQDHFIFDCFC
jgi:hypothetical protein